MSLKCQSRTLLCILIGVFAFVAVESRSYNNGLIFYDLETRVPYLPPTVSVSRGRILSNVQYSKKGSIWSTFGQPCECKGAICGCCAGIKVKQFNFDQKMCANVTYMMPKQEALLEVYLNEKPSSKYGLSVRNPSPFCIPVMMGVPMAMCVQMYNIAVQGNNLNMCMDFVVRLASTDLMEMHFQCMKMGLDGLMYVDASGQPVIPPSQSKVESVEPTNDAVEDYYDETGEGETAAVESGTESDDREQENEVNVENTQVESENDHDNDNKIEHEYESENYNNVYGTPIVVLEENTENAEKEMTPDEQGEQSELPTQSEQLEEKDVEADKVVEEEEEEKEEEEKEILKVETEPAGAELEATTSFAAQESYQDVATENQLPAISSPDEQYENVNQDEEENVEQKLDSTVTQTNEAENEINDALIDNSIATTAPTTTETNDEVDNTAATTTELPTTTTTADDSENDSNDNYNDNYNYDDLADEVSNSDQTIETAAADSDVTESNVDDVSETSADAALDAAPDTEMTQQNVAYEDANALQATQSSAPVITATDVTDALPDATEAMNATEKAESAVAEEAAPAEASAISSTTTAAPPAASQYDLARVIYRRRAYG